MQQRMPRAQMGAFSDASIAKQVVRRGSDDLIGGV